MVYQVYPKSFCDSDEDGVGDIPGIISKLDYIKSIGVDVIWLSPFFKSPGFDNGYDVSDYFSVDPVFGTMNDFKVLLNEAHQRGLKIIIDLVVNHSSHQHLWFQESSKSKNNPYRNYYFWRDGLTEDEAIQRWGQDNLPSYDLSKDKRMRFPPNNWQNLFGGGSCWEYDKETDQYYLHLFSKEQPDLNWDSPKLRQDVYDMMHQWLELGVDGFRMDVISLISKPEGLPDVTDGQSLIDIVANGSKVHIYLREMREVALAGFDVMTVGETAGVTVDEAKHYAGLENTELNMVFHFEINDLDGGESHKWNRSKIKLTDLKNIHKKWQQGLAGIAWNSLYLSNHDQPRSIGRYVRPDEVYRERAQKMLATVTYLMAGTPFIYQGEELAMTNCFIKDFADLRDIESINAFHKMLQTGLDAEEAMEIVGIWGRDSCRTPMQWNGEVGAGFTKAKPWLKINENYVAINAKEQAARKDSVFHYYRALFALRKGMDVFVMGDYVPVLEEDERVFAYNRVLDGESVFVLGNYTGYEVQLFLDMGIDANVLMGNIVDSDFLTTKVLQPYEGVVISGVPSMTPCKPL